MNQTIEVMKKHCSIRKFTDKPIDHDLLRELITAGHAAPSVGFFQARTVIRITDPAIRTELSRLSCLENRFMIDAPEVLMLCADLHRTNQCCEWHGTQPNTAMMNQFLLATIDTSLMAQNVATAAESMGLGTSFLCSYRGKETQVSELLELPDSVCPIFAICIGYPDETPEYKTRLPIDFILHENTYNSEKYNLDNLLDYNLKIKDYYERRGDDIHCATELPGQTINKKPVFYSEQMAEIGSRPGYGSGLLEFLHSRNLAIK